MCGILGVTGQLPQKEKFLSALHKLTHRGPDGFGIYQNTEVLLGHRRLSIIDLSENGKQPFVIDHYAITFNGEIYNYLELKKELETLGHVFYSDSDTEVLLRSFLQWGPNCLKRLNGMWAFVIYNSNEKQLFISRDRFGQKPLFFYENSKSFMFSSEMKGLTPLIPEVKVSKKFHEFNLNSFAYESTSETLLADIKRFPAGHYGYYSMTSKKLQIHKYWDLLENLVEVPKSYEEQKEQFRSLFFDSCALRMRADVSIGSSLSGGVDSSAVVSAMSRIGRSNQFNHTSIDWQHAFVAQFPGSFLDETKYAKKVIEATGVEGHFINPDQSKEIQNINQYFYFFEEVDATSPIPMSLIYKSIKESGVTVSLDGHGVDESYSGYGMSILEALLDTSNPRHIIDILDTYNNLHPKEFSQGVPSNSLMMYLIFLYTRRKTAFRNLVKRFPLIGRIQKEGTIEKLGNFNFNLYLLFTQSILPTLLRNYDRYSMMHGVEVRMPFMDYRLVSFAFSLPWNAKIKDGYSKYIIRDSLQDIIPQEVIWRKTKIGFQSPLTEYFKGPWREYIEDEIHSLKCKNSSLVKQNELKSDFNKLVNKSQGSFESGKNFWKKMTPYFWEQGFLNQCR